MRLKDKVVFVGAAGGGIGTAVPVLFAQEGAKIVLAARRMDPLEEIAAKVRAVGGEASCVSADLVTPEGAQRAMAHVEQTHGRLDVLFSNLGDSAGRGLRLHDTDEDTWKFLTDINLTGHYLCSRYALPMMLRQGGGVIVLMTASYDVRLRTHSGYSAGKAGTIALVHTMARQYRKDNIRVVGLASSSVGGRIPEAGVTPPDLRLARAGSPEDIAYAALYLASDEAAWVSGTVLNVDGAGEASLEGATP